MTLTFNDYITDYMKYIALYIAKGYPSKETLVTYKKHIAGYLSWCKEKRVTPEKATNLDIRVYIQDLRTHYKDKSIRIKFNAVRAFYRVAIELGLLTINPTRNISVGYDMNEPVYYYSLEDIKKIKHYFESEDDPFIRYRNLLILYLMAVEGLRVSEVRALAMKDINWMSNIIHIESGPSKRYIYPSSYTIEILAKYIQTLPEAIQSNDMAPVILSGSNAAKAKQISANGLRYIINTALDACNLKQTTMNGQSLYISCNALRNSCGVNLFNETKDLGLIQKILGHVSPQATQRYANANYEVNRKTELIAKKLNK